MKKIIAKINNGEFLLKNLQWSNSKTVWYILTGINRGISPSHVTKVAKSIEKLGNLRPIVVADLSFISGKLQTYIIDGQHLFNACLRLGWSIPYIKIEIKSKEQLVEAIALLNASSKSWCMLDYVTAWSYLKSDYVKLNNYFTIYDIELSVLASILMNSTGDTAVVTRKIKAGEFAIINEEDNVKILNYLTDLLKVAPRMNRFENKYVCREFVCFLRGNPSYNHTVFIENAKKNKDKFILATQEEGKLSTLFNKLNSKSK